MFRFADMREKDIREKLEGDADCCRYIGYLYDICDGEVVLDTSNDEMAGYVFIKQKEEQGFIFNLFVKEQYRRQGVGEKLFTDAVEKYGGKDLLVDIGNDGAIRLYERHGFTIVDTVDGQYYMRRKGLPD